MRVAVLGAHGFLGRHVVETLVAGGLEVLHPVRGTGGRPVAAGAHAHAVAANDRALSGWLRDVAPAAVVDCAWSGVHGAARDDVGCQESNVRRVATLVADIPVETTNWIGLGSQAEYGPINGKISEDHPLRPATAYGRAKVDAQDLLRRELAPRGIAVSWLRVFAAYGPHQPRGWLIPDAIASLLGDEDVVLHNPAQSCDYVYAGDVARAVAAVLSAPAEATYNVGRGDTITVEEIVTLARDILGSAGRVYAQTGGTAGWWAADVTALRRRTGWQPTTSHRAGLEATVRSLRGDGSAAGT